MGEAADVDVRFASADRQRFFKCFGANLRLKLDFRCKANAKH
jgi:hypothetical protein